MLRTSLVQTMVKHPVNETKEQTLVRRHVQTATPILPKISRLETVHRKGPKTRKNSKIYRTSSRNKLSNSTSKISSIRSHRVIEARYNAMEGQLVTISNQSIVHFTRRDKTKGSRHRAKPRLTWMRALLKTIDEIVVST